MILTGDNLFVARFFMLGFHEAREFDGSCMRSSRAMCRNLAMVQVGGLD